MERKLWSLGSISTLLKSNRILFWAIGASVTSKLILCAFVITVDSRRFLAADSPAYENCAMALLETGRFASSPDNPDQPETLRTPGYPAFLAFLYGTFFPDPVVAVFAQILISAATMLLVSWIAQELWGRQTASVAILLFVFDMGFFAYSLILMTETLFTFLLLCSLATLIPLFRIPARNKFAFFSGLFLAVATMVRPISYYLFFPIFFGLIFIVVRQRLGWKGVYAPLLFLFPFLFVVGAWQTRNYVLTGHATLSRIEGDLLRKKSAEVVAIRDKITFEEAEKKLVAQQTQQLRDSKSPEKIDRFWRKEGLLYLVEYPSYYIRKEAKRAPRIFAPAGQMMFALFGHSLSWWPLRHLRTLSLDKFIRIWFIKRPGWLVFTVLILLHIFLLYAGGMLALWYGWKRRPIRSIHYMYAVIFLYFLGISFAIGFKSRFLLPAMPLLHLYTARAIILTAKTPG